ncbi:Ima1 N-terminal domain-containing protein [Cyathus striatus]|nr:Ima1 N-terminal domain-containing protein [Cyathus striatus]
MSDEPAMHDENLNSGSFSKRASPSKDRLPTMYGPGPFCHNCQTNQMLLVNLLSNYLPSPESPDYERRLEMLPEYRESLQQRYPPVCDNCLPAVEEEIRKKDQMARAKALGGWLQQSKGKERQRRVSGTNTDREKITMEMKLWRARGILWLMSLGLSVVGSISAAIGSHVLRPLAFVQPILPIIVLFSLLWTAWDPTYSSFRKSQLQGRDVRVKGKKEYIILQMLAWLTRLITSVLISVSSFKSHLDYLNLQHPNSFRSRVYFTVITFVEFTVLLSSCMIIRLQHPPAIRLIDTNSHKLASSRSDTPNPATRMGTPSDTAFPTAVDPDILAGLSLSSKPVITPTKPVFGLPSLLASVPPVTDKDENKDEMDWTPTNADGSSPSKGKYRRSDDDASWLRPQRFFAPEKPTGLEGLFERTKLVDDRMAVDQPTRSPKSTLSTWSWCLIIATICVPLIGIGTYRIWSVRQRVNSSTNADPTVT